MMSRPIENLADRMPVVGLEYRDVVLVVGLQTGRIGGEIALPRDVDPHLDFYRLRILTIGVVVFEGSPRARNEQLPRYVVWDNKLAEAGTKDTLGVGDESVDVLVRARRNWWAGPPKGAFDERHLLQRH